MNKKDLTLIFTGDIGFDHYLTNLWQNDNLLKKEVMDFLNSGDCVIGNIEGALYDKGNNSERGIFFHSIDPQVVSFLKKANINIWSLGNNHIMDCGVAGLENTLKLAKDNECMTMGAGINENEARKIIYFPQAGGVGMFNVAYMNECIPADENMAGVFRWDNMKAIKENIDEIKKSCRYCIMVVHGGEEFADLPNPYTRDRYLKYLDMGADVIIAHHPHVIENYEIIEDGKMIFYSLGNFLFDTDYQRVHPYTENGILLKLLINEEKINFSFLPIKINRQKEIVEIINTPTIFTNINQVEYNLLAPLAAKVFLEEEKKKMIFLEPGEYLQATDEKWTAYFNSTNPDGYDKGAHMDLRIIKQISELADNNNWQASKLDAVKEYLLSHIK